MKPYLCIALLLVCTYSCQKGVSDKDPNQTGLLSDSTTSPLPTGSSSSACSLRPLYGDTLILPQPGQTSIVPVNSPGTGQYFSWPAGMALNQQTGVVDLTQSQAGMRYAIGFVPTGTKDTCISTLIIGGAAYYDSLYVMSNDDDDDSLPRPYFNANSSLANVCSTPGACTFDYDGQAAKKGIIVDPATGTIRISETVNGNGQGKGLFNGNAHNGATAVVNIAYKLNDGSNNAPQSIQVKIEYYESIAQVPPGQLSIMQSQTFNALNDRLLTTGRNPRPPVIIIVRRN